MKGKSFFRPVILFVFVSLALASSHADTAREIIADSGIKGGLIVHVGCGDGRLTIALHAGESYIVHGLDTDVQGIERARRYIRSLGLYGKVSVDTFDGANLPYTDNLVNLLVVSKAYRISKGEMLRVLAPRGVAYIRKGDGWRRIVKPWPPNIDEWTHYLHDPSNNAVAHDTEVGPPRHMQWLGEPRWTRNHHKLNSISSVVTAGGRLFYIVDKATAANMNVPGKWMLVARDAFNGVRLWEKRLKSWAWYKRGFRSGPPQLPRLLVASKDRIYAPLGLNLPVSQIDAASGKTLRTYDDTAGAEEIILVDNILLVLKGSPVAEQAIGHPAFKGKLKLPNSKSIVAVDTSSGDKLWEWSEPGADPMPETLASADGKVFFQLGEGVVCLDLRSGHKLWTYGETTKRDPNWKVTFGKHTLVVADGVVLCKLSGKLVAISAEDGEKLWECDDGAGFHSPPDIFVINGLVWHGFHPFDSVAPPPVNDFNEARDLHTGEVKRMNSIMVDLQTSGHHHRCYREKATDRYIITGKRGVEMMDLQGEDHSRNNWVRGTCQYGILPANGLIYAPPHSCGCYMESKLWGFWALAARRSVVSDPRRRFSDEGRLEKGPAYGRIPESAEGSEGKESWPTYRHDALRSGVAGTDVPWKLKRAWKRNIGGRLTQPVVADGRVVLSAVDENTVYALDEESGRLIWAFTAGGRVDSPPTIYRGLVLFGCADGCVYCLRLSDGELVWRFHAAPADLRGVAFDQVESLWPVHGSVLILDGVVYCSAGRSSWLDGGIYLYGLDPASGRIICKSHLQSKHPEFRGGKEKAKEGYNTRIGQNTTDYKTFLQSDRSDSFSMVGATNDVLVSDGESVFMRHVKFNRKLEKQEEMSRHLFSTSSLLDGTENHRSHWILGTGDFRGLPVAYSWIVNRQRRREGEISIAVPYGLMMVYDTHAVWGVHRKGRADGNYALFERRNRPFAKGERPLPDFRRLPKDTQPFPYVWSRDIKIRPRALLKSRDKLFIGAMPTDIPKDDPHAAYEGREGGMLWVVSAEDGGKIAEYKLASPVVWDGMAAANGRLFISTSNGSILCYAEDK